MNEKDTNTAKMISGVEVWDANTDSQKDKSQTMWKL